MSNTGKVTAMTVEKSATIDVDGKLEQRKKLAADLTKKLADFEKELETKNYLVEGKIETAEKLLAFVTEEAEWKFSEALGIVETQSQLSKIKDNLAKGKSTEIMLSHLALEALYYFLSKGTGKGVETAKTYLALLKPITDALSRAKQDKDKKDQMVKDLGTLESAIDTGAVSDVEEGMIDEISQELSEDQK